MDNPSNEAPKSEGVGFDAEAQQKNFAKRAERAQARDTDLRANAITRAFTDIRGENPKTKWEGKEVDATRSAILASKALREIQDASSNGRPFDKDFFEKSAKVLYVEEEGAKMYNLHAPGLEHHTLTPDEQRKYGELMQRAVDAYESPISQEMIDAYDRKIAPRYDVADRMEPFLQSLQERNGALRIPDDEKKFAEMYLDSPSRAKAQIMKDIVEAIPKEYLVSKKPPFLSRLSRSRQQPPERNALIPKYKGVSDEQVAQALHDVLGYDFENGKMPENLEVNEATGESAQEQTDKFLEFVGSVDADIPLDPGEAKISSIVESALYQQPKLKEELFHSYQQDGLVGLKARVLATVLRTGVFTGSGRPVMQLAKIIDYKTS